MFEFPEVMDDDGNIIGFDVVFENLPYMSVQEKQKPQHDAKIFYEQNYFIAKSAYDLVNLAYHISKTLCL